MLETIQDVVRDGAIISGSLFAFNRINLFTHEIAHALAKRSLAGRDSIDIINIGGKPLFDFEAFNIRFEFGAEYKGYVDGFPLRGVKKQIEAIMGPVVSTINTAAITLGAASILPTAFENLGMNPIVANVAATALAVWAAKDQLWAMLPFPGSDIHTFLNTNKQ